MPSEPAVEPATEPVVEPAVEPGVDEPAPRSTRQRWIRRVLLASVVATLLGALVLTTTNIMVTTAANGLAFDDAASVPERPVAIVFGAGIIAGQPSPALADRIDGGVALYKQGRVSHLLMTGDNSVVTYDEVTVMREHAIKAGVPASAITRDYAGFNTYDSCYRARDIFGVRAAVLVTQDYHLSRALYTCRGLGIDAVGLIIPDWQHHPERMTRGQYPVSQSTYYMGREWFARTKSVLAGITEPQPKVLGPYEGLRET